MDKEYTGALLGDIQKAPTNEEKISLMSILLSDMVSENQKKTDLLEQVQENLSLSLNLGQELLRGLSGAVKRMESAEEALNTLAKITADTAEGAAHSAETINKIYDHIQRHEESFAKLHQTISDIYDDLDKIQTKL
jgi:uncharacterized coiled-coil DUF342 family protein